MALTDANMTLWDAEALASSTAYVSDSYDTGLGVNDIATGEPVEAVLQVDVAATNSGTYKFDVVESATADLGTPNVLATRTILYSDLTAGSRHRFPIPAGLKTLRYVGFKLTNTGGTITVTGFLSESDQVDARKNYPSGSSIQ